MSNGRIIFDIQRRLFHEKLKAFQRYTAELEAKFQADFAKLESEFKPEFEEYEEYIDYIETLIDEKLLIENVFVNQFRNSTLISICSLLEHRLNVLAGLMGKLKKTDLLISDLSGAGTVRSKTYLEKVCGIDFKPLNGEWSVLLDLSKVRNCIVHCESDTTKTRARNTLEKVISNTRGLSLKQDKYILVSSEYLSYIIDNSQSFFDGVIDSSYELYKTYNKSSQQDAVKRASV